MGKRDINDNDVIENHNNLLIPTHFFYYLIRGIRKPLLTCKTMEVAFFVILLIYGGDTGITETKGGKMRKDTNKRIKFIVERLRGVPVVPVLVEPFKNDNDFSITNINELMVYIEEYVAQGKNTTKIWRCPGCSKIS